MPPGPPSLGPVLLPLSGLLVAQFVSGLSATIVATSIPTIMHTLSGPASHATWLVAATILGNTASTPIWGRLADLFAPKRIVQIAIALFVLGSIGAGLSADTTQLLTARAVQGIGLGGLGASAAVVVAMLVSPRERGRVNSWLVSVQTTATILGPVVGGFIVQSTLGWRWCFFVAVPLAVASIVVLALTLRLAERPARASGRTDIAGAFLIATGVTAVLIAVTTLSDDDWSFTPVSALVGGYGVVAIIALVIVELRVTSPVIPLRLLAQRTGALCVTAAFTIGFTLFGGSVFVTQYLQLGLGIPPATAGLLLAPMAIGTVGASILAGRMISRTGLVKAVLVGGASLCLAGNIALALAPLAPLPLALVGTVLLSAGLGSTTQNLVLAGQTVAGANRVGSVSATVMFFFTLGGTVGLVLLGAVLAHSVSGLRASGASEQLAYSAGLPTVFALSGVSTLVALVALVFLRSIRLASAQG
ncbi:MFS transporter [Subtercola boreus]|uniref:MFS transporter n=1 Tax=Subtercola boreus TaxID=120213 RepID=UPI0011685F60|nr:MFS transporter [Subtercola boreus]TQL52959.1 MFS transporter [Subtercola boreus]